MGRASLKTATNPAIDPGAPWRIRLHVGPAFSTAFVQVTRTFVAPLARVLIPDHPPLRCRWSGTGAVSCTCLFQGVG